MVFSGCGDGRREGPWRWSWSGAEQRVRRLFWETIYLFCMAAIMAGLVPAAHSICLVGSH